MVSVIAKYVRNRRQHKALCELFDKTDTGGDGTISIKEYIAMCDEYGIELTEEHLGVVRSISNENGEVRKNDFICHIKNTPGMFGLFEKTDPESETHWQNLAITAFKIFDKNYDGYIDKDEFRWMTTSDIISNKTIKTVFERCDADGNGKLDYQEFKAMIFRYKAKKEEEGSAETVRRHSKDRKKVRKDLKKDIKKMEKTQTMNNNFSF